MCYSTTINPLNHNIVIKVIFANNQILYNYLGTLCCQNCLCDHADQKDYIW